MQKKPFQILTLQNINYLTVSATFSYSYMSWLIIIWSKFLYLSCFFLAAHPQASIVFLLYTIWRNLRIKKKTLWPLFMDGPPQGYSHFEEAVYFLPFSSQKFLVLILSTTEGWKAESTLEPPSGFEHGTPGSGIQRLNH